MAEKDGMETERVTRHKAAEAAFLASTDAARGTPGMTWDR